MIDLKNKKILVAGGNGFIGSHVCAALEKRGVLRERIVIPLPETHDLRVWEKCAGAVKGIDIVFDCAAVPGDILLRAKIPGQLFYENLIMGVHLVEAAFQEGVQKIITIGSATEYPESAPTPLKEIDLWNGLPSPGNIPYGLSKRIAALQGEMYRRQSGFHAIHVLLTNAYGPGERYESGYMVPSLIQKFLGAKERGEKEVEVWGTGNAVRDLIFADDAAEGILRAAEDYDDVSPLNLASGTGISIKELAELLSSIAGFDGTVRWNTDKPEGDLKRLLDVTRAEQLIGFKAKTPLEEGLKKTIAWHNAQSSS